MKLIICAASRSTGPATTSALADYSDAIEFFGADKKKISSRVFLKAEINGVRGLFILDTGATYVAMKAAFAARAKIPQGDASGITVNTANGPVKAKLSRADTMRLGHLEAVNVPVAVQDDKKIYGGGVDGLLGMSFLSRFEVQMISGMVEVHTRQPNK